MSAGLEVTGLDEADTKLDTLAERINTAVVGAMVAHGGLIVSTASGIAPKNTGRMAAALSTSPMSWPGRGDGVTVSAGAETVPYAYTFHSGMVGKPQTSDATGLPLAPKVSGGYMVFRVNGYTRSRTGRSGVGGFVSGYSALRKIHLNPYLFIAVIQLKNRLQQAIDIAAGEATNQ